MNRRIAMGGAVALGLSVFLVAPAAQAEETGTAPSTTGTIWYSTSFDAALSDTRATGHIEFVDAKSALHIWTEATTSTDKVAEYVDANKPLADVGTPSLDYTHSSGVLPGYQLVVDFDNDGSADGILVGETVYGDDWWLSNNAAQSVKDAAPQKGGSGFGGEYHGTLAQWSDAFDDAVVKAFGFSLGSGVKGDGVLNAITFADTRYTFDAVILPSKDECKGGGWATSTAPVYKNQGECVSHFATATNNGNKSNAPATSPATGTGVTAGPSTAAGASPVVSRTGTGGTTKRI